MRWKKVFVLAAAFASVVQDGFAQFSYSASAVIPPDLLREFRGVWVTTIKNSADWPSQPGLSTSQQRTELLTLLDRVARLNLNAIILQVRPQADAFYASKTEPWSEYLTGTMGKAPEPFYDPLAFAIEEAHKRGLELHAWFNPYRALHSSHSGSIATNHVSKSHPELVRSFGKYLWLDPGEPQVQNYCLGVVMDVVRRYDIDGVQFDDYFYPSAKDSGATNSDFPDDASWKKYGVRTHLKRDDWRRANVDLFIERVYRSIKATKPWVKFGISPPGIWRPGFPPQIKGADTYSEIYADSRKWLANGWLDYFAPQLYWPIESKEQSFPVLLNWWRSQNVRGRHLWPGLAAYRALDWSASEIPNQIRFIRQFPNDSGFIFFRTASVFDDSALTEPLEHQMPALVPASTWLARTLPGAPIIATTTQQSPLALRVRWRNTGPEPIRLWAMQLRLNNHWTTQILPADHTWQIFYGAPWEIPEVISIRAIDRTGIASLPSVVGQTIFTGIAGTNDFRGGPPSRPRPSGQPGPQRR